MSTEDTLETLVDGVAIPLNPAEVSMAREGEGWSVFYRDDRYDLRRLYEGCGLQEAAAVCEEFHATGSLSRASIPARYRTNPIGSTSGDHDRRGAFAGKDVPIDADQRRSLEKRLSPHGLMLGECLSHDGIRLVVCRSDNGVPVSSLLRGAGGVEDWLDRAGAMLASCDRRWLAPLSDDFLAKFSGRLRGDIERLKQKKAKHDNSAERCLAFFKENDTGDTYHDDWKKSAGTELAISLKCQRHMDRLAAKLERLSNDPASLFLPIGARVRLKKDMGFPADWALDGGHYGPSPVAGSQGVVVGVPSRGEWGVLVAFPHAFRDTDGTRWLPDGLEPIKIYFDAADLDMLEYGRFVDGRECRSAEFERTHVHDEYRDDYGDMVVIAGGKPWRIMGFSLGKDEHWTDGQQWESLERMSFLTPLDAWFQETDTGVEEGNGADPGI